MIQICKGRVGWKKDISQFTFVGPYDNSVIAYVSRDMTKPTIWLCAQRRLRSTWASAQTDQRRRCPHEKNLGSSATYWAQKTDQTGRMPRLIWVFAGSTLILLVLSCRDSCVLSKFNTASDQKFYNRIPNWIATFSYQLKTLISSNHVWSSMVYVKQAMTSTLL